MEVMQDVFIFDVINISLINENKDTIELYRSYGEMFNTTHQKQYKDILIPLKSQWPSVWEVIKPRFTIIF